MKQKVVVLLLNLMFFGFTVFVFITKGITKKIVLWKFLASLSGVIVFGFFIFFIIRELKK